MIQPNYLNTLNFVYLQLVRLHHADVEIYVT